MKNLNVLRNYRDCYYGLTVGKDVVLGNLCCTANQLEIWLKTVLYSGGWQGGSCISLTWTHSCGCLQLWAGCAHWTTWPLSCPMVFYPLGLVMALWSQGSKGMIVEFEGLWRLVLSDHRASVLLVGRSTSLGWLRLKGLGSRLHLPIGGMVKSP